MEPELLRMEPVCGTSRNLVQGFGRLPHTTPKLYWKNPKLFKLLGNIAKKQSSATHSVDVVHVVLCNITKSKLPITFPITDNPMFKTPQTSACADAKVPMSYLLSSQRILTTFVCRQSASGNRLLFGCTSSQILQR